MTKTDYRILEGLADAEVLEAQTPTTLARNLGISRQWASRRLGDLVEQGLVEKIEDGWYRITDDGRRKIADP